MVRWLQNSNGKDIHHEKGPTHVVLNYTLCVMTDLHLNNILYWRFHSVQVNHERRSLLQHPLIYSYINYKWWKMSFPLFLLYVLCYGLFLILLISFTLTLPRPGPTNELCKMIVNLRTHDGIYYMKTKQHMYAIYR